MDIRLANGDRAIINNILVYFNQMTPGKGMDWDDAEMIASIRKELALRDFSTEDVISDTERHDENDYELELAEIRWIKNRLDERLKEKSLPGLHAEFVVTLKPRMEELAKAKPSEKELAEMEAEKAEKEAAKAEGKDELKDA